MKFEMLMHFGLLNRMPEKKSKLKNSRWQKAIVLKMKIVIYHFRFPKNVELILKLVIKQQI